MWFEQERAGDKGAGLTRKKAEEIRAVEIDAELRQVKSMVDGSFNVLLNVPEYCLPQVQQLLEWLNDEIRAVIAIHINGE